MLTWSTCSDIVTQRKEEDDDDDDDAEAPKPNRSRASTSCMPMSHNSSTPQLQLHNGRVFEMNPPGPASGSVCDQAASTHDGQRVVFHGLLVQESIGGNTICCRPTRLFDCEVRVFPSCKGYYHCTWHGVLLPFHPCLFHGFLRASPSPTSDKIVIGCLPPSAPPSSMGSTRAWSNQGTKE